MLFHGYPHLEDGTMDGGSSNESGIHCWALSHFDVEPIVSSEGTFPDRIEESAWVPESISPSSLDCAPHGSPAR